jgi:hypothetical protein
MKLALRTKILVGAAALIGAYVMFSPDEGVTVVGERDAEHASAGTRAHAPQGAARGAGAAQALALFAHRVADATAAGSLFSAHSWYVAPPPPPPVVAAPVEPPKPVAPPLPFQYIGSYQAAERRIAGAAKTDGATAAVPVHGQLCAPG